MPMRVPASTGGLEPGSLGAPGLAAAVYAASTMAIKVDTPAEQNYLSQLASRLGISSGVRTSLDTSLGIGRSI